MSAARRRNPLAIFAVRDIVVHVSPYSTVCFLRRGLLLFRWVSILVLAILLWVNWRVGTAYALAWFICLMLKAFFSNGRGFGGHLRPPDAGTPSRLNPKPPIRMAANVVEPLRQDQ